MRYSASLCFLRPWRFPNLISKNSNNSAELVYFSGGTSQRRSPKPTVTLMQINLGSNSIRKTQATQFQNISNERRCSVGHLGLESQRIPKIGELPVIIHLDGILLYKPSILAPTMETPMAMSVLLGGSTWRLRLGLSPQTGEEQRKRRGHPWLSTADWDPFRFF